MKRIKPSGAQFEKIRTKKQHTENLSKEFMLNYVKSHNKENSDTSNNHSVSGSNLENPTQHVIDECTSYIENEVEYLSKEIPETENAGQPSVGIDSDVIFLLKRANKKGESLDLTPKGMLLYISSLGLEAYKTLVTALKILLTLPLSVASFERSFSKLKLIKSYLRTTMNQDRLSNLAILSIENEVAASLDYNDIITEFAAIKARKVIF